MKETKKQEDVVKNVIKSTVAEKKTKRKSEKLKAKSRALVCHMTNCCQQTAKSQKG